MIHNQRALVSGANGFVGQALCAALLSRAWNVRRATRRGALVGDFEIGDVGLATDWRRAVDGVDCIVHLAARTHVLRDEARDPIGAYRRVNVDGTINIARTAAMHGVRRFVFLSSIKVNGERTGGTAFTENDQPQPIDAYGISKLEAEQALWQIAKETGLEVTVLRPPLVYGPGVKANFLRLMQIIARTLPMPLASIKNYRSLIYLGNLVSAIVSCMESPTAASKTYLVSDRETVSTPELLRQIASALGVKPRLFPCPAFLLSVSAAFLGRTSEWERLSGSLQIDCSKIDFELNWQPPYTMTQGLAQTAQWYHSQFPAKSNT